MSQGGSPYVMRLLLVEDDPSLASGIRIALKPEHYTVDHLTDGESALNALQSEPFDAVILDLGLPNVDGIEVLRTIRRHGNHVPILVLTARDAVDHRIEGLDSGADDYLTKPFHEAELMARLKALLRRQSGQLSQVITLNGISLDEAGQRVCLEGETWRSLTATEFRLLRYLMLHPDRIHSKEQLLEQLYALDQDAAAPNLVEVYIARLRRYLGKSVIQTRRGQGYFFASH